MENKEYPNWLRYLVKLARPGAMLGMFLLLIFGGLLFATVEFFAPGRGAQAMEVFVKFFDAIDDQYYETLRFMFGTYVAGRSFQEIAKNVYKPKVKEG